MGEMERNAFSRPRRLLLATATATLTAAALYLALAAVSTANTPKARYVLRHPAREECRANYRRRVTHVRERRRDKVRSVRQVICIYVAPKATEPALTPPTLPAAAIGPFATTTELGFDPSSPTSTPYGSCFSYFVEEEKGMGCDLHLMVTVRSATGLLTIPSRTTNLVLINPERPGERWEVPVEGDLWIRTGWWYWRPANETRTSVSTITWTEGKGFVVTKNIAVTQHAGFFNGPPWSATASFGGSTEFLPSTSQTLELPY
jgi:hypothetical protein